jgi:predicted ribosomally synthesized peptide with SipW-like signal peptide
MEKKPLLISVAVALAAGSLAIGGTFALFTSHAENDIVVTAGKISVTETIELVKVMSADVEETITDNAATFANGGTVKVVDGKLILDKMTPMDSVEVKVTPKNESNVNIKYRSILSASGELASGLTATINGTTADLSKPVRSDWTALAAEAALPADLTKDVVIALPETAGNEYQEKAAQISFGVKAIQGNGNTAAYTLDDAAKTLLIKDEEGLEYFASQVTGGTYYAGYTVTLAADMDLGMYRNWTAIGPAIAGTGSSGNGFAGTFDGAAHTISGLTVKGVGVQGFFSNICGGAVIKNVTFANASVTGLEGVYPCAAVVAGNVYSGATLENINVTGAKVLSNHYAGGLVAYGYSVTVKNCVVDGSTIVSEPDLQADGSYDNGDKAGGLIGCSCDYYGVEGNTVKNSSITAYRDVGGLIGMQSSDGGSKATFGVNTVTNVHVTADQSKKSYGAKTFNAAAFVGRDNTDSTRPLDVSACTGSGNVIQTIAVDGTVTTL